MLQRFQITNLFNLYSYDLNLSNESEDNIRFITGPNGYGKTTILRFISAIYQMDLSPLFDRNNPFEKLIMTIDDAVLTIERVVRIKAVRIEDGDEGLDEEVVLYCTFKTQEQEEHFDVPEDKASTPSHMGFNFQLFFMSHRSHFITDKRILLTNDDLQNAQNDTNDEKPVSPIMKRARAFANELKRNVVTSRVRWEKGEAMPEDEYYAKSRELEEKILRLQKYHLVEGDVLASADYSEESLRPYLSINLLRLEQSVKKAESFLERVEMFDRIIAGFDFADKIFEINPNSKEEDSSLKTGFRFILQDADKTKILNDKLSSGETHLVVMFYDLLFKASMDEMLFLIDEPELSFHLAWQKDFLDILRDVCRLRKLQCVLATHSTDMFASDFDITADLFESRIEE